MKNLFSAFGWGGAGFAELEVQNSTRSEPDSGESDENDFDSLKSLFTKLYGKNQDLSTVSSTDLTNLISSHQVSVTFDCSTYEGLRENLLS